MHSPPTRRALTYLEVAMAQPSWRSDKRKTAERGYGGKWQRERATFLDANPLCERCERLGRMTPSTVVNHRIPHRGDMKQFWDRKNWEPACKPHHDGDITPMRGRLRERGRR